MGPSVSNRPFPKGWMIRISTADAAMTRSACPLVNLELRSSLPTPSLTQPQYTGGVLQVVPFTIHHQIPN